MYNRWIQYLKWNRRRRKNKNNPKKNQQTKSQKKNMEDIRIPPKHIWTPDLLMYNRFVIEEYLQLYQFNISFQCWRGFRWNLSHKCDCYKWGHVHLHPTWHLQVHLQDRHHLVPLRRPGECLCQKHISKCKTFNNQDCDMKFGSWTYDGFKVDLKLKAEAGDLGTYTNNGEWDLLSETTTQFFFGQYL